MVWHSCTGSQLSERIR